MSHGEGFQHKSIMCTVYVGSRSMGGPGGVAPGSSYGVIVNIILCNRTEIKGILHILLYTNVPMCMRSIT